MASSSETVTVLGKSSEKTTSFTLTGAAPPTAMTAATATAAPAPASLYAYSANSSSATDDDDRPTPFPEYREPEEEDAFDDDDRYAQNGFLFGANLAVAPEPTPSLTTSALSDAHVSEEPPPKKTIEHATSTSHAQPSPANTPPPPLQQPPQQPEPPSHESEVEESLLPTLLSGPEPLSKPHSDPQSDAQPESIPKSNPESESESRPQQPQPQPQPQSQSQSQSQPESHAESQPKTSPKSQLPPPPYWMHSRVGPRNGIQTNDGPAWPPVAPMTSQNNQFLRPNGHQQHHHHHTRDVSNVSNASTQLNLITLQDNEEAETVSPASSSSSPTASTTAATSTSVAPLSRCWAKRIELTDYVIVRGRSPISGISNLGNLGNLGNVGAPAFVVWTVRVETLEGGTFVLHKRYSEFDILRQRLVASFPTACAAAVPPLPPKRVLGKFGARFLERRRLGLQYFLNCILLNPEFAGSPVLREFLFS